jgi:hypothetical protein
MALGNRGVTFRAPHGLGHDIRLGFFLAQGFSPDEFRLRLVTMGAPGFRLVVTAQALHPRLEDLPMFFSGGVTDITVQYPGDMFLMGKREVIDLDFGIFEPFVTFGALGVGNLRGLGKWNGPLGMARRARGLLPAMTFKTGLLRRTERGRIMGVVINIVVAGGAIVLQLLNVEAVRDRDIIRVDFRRGSLHIENLLVAADTVRVDLVELGRKTRMLSSTLQRKDINARHQGVARCMTFRAADLGMEVRLLPKRGFPLLMVAGDAEFLLGRGIGGQADSGIEDQHRQNTAQGPGPERKAGKFKIQRHSPPIPL